MTRVCQQCGAQFSDRPVIDGKERHLNGRLLCLACRPFKPRRSPRVYTRQPVKQLTCRRCGAPFPAKAKINGKVRSLYRRKFCLVCSPFGAHNTSKNPIGDSPNPETERKQRRTDSWYRYQRKRRIERKAKLVALRGGHCEECGYGDAIAALEFHHLDSKTKEFGLGTFNGSWQRLLAEADKCVLLCANCHRRRHGYVGSPEARVKKGRAIELMGAACQGCNEVVPDSLFEFHHLDARQKSFGISRDGLARKWEEIAAELLKCVMLCANCHREVHASLRTLEAQGNFRFAETAVRTSVAA